MKTYFEKLLATFDYAGMGEWVKSLFPTFKYQHLTLLTVSMSVTASAIDMVFGMTGLAFLGFILIMVVELASGIRASQIRKEPFSSLRLSRFSFKLFYYLVIISATYLLSTSYQAHGKELTASAFSWLHMFLVVQIMMENIVSILENIAVIDGKDKTHWIKRIQDKISSML